MHRCRRCAVALMLHRAEAPYHGGRSQDLLKVKQWLDSEAKVIADRSGNGKYQKGLGPWRWRRQRGSDFFLAPVSAMPNAVNHRHLAVRLPGVGCRSVPERKCLRVGGLSATIKFAKLSIINTSCGNRVGLGRRDMHRQSATAICDTY